MPLSDYTKVVFAGGGNRCFWQAGFWHTVAEPLNLAPKQIGAVSAGSAIACMLMSDKFDETFQYLKKIMGENKKNSYPTNIFKKKPIFPHEEMYRSAIIEMMDDETLKKLQSGPNIWIEFARIPEWLGPKSGTFVGLLAYNIEKRIKAPVHPVAGRKLGFIPEFISIRDCPTPEALADLILASSCTPPITPIAFFKGTPALDGGLVDNVPIEAVEQFDGKTLVLLSRRYKNLPRAKDKIYVQPTEPIPVAGWDYTDPAKVQATYDLGKRDGELFLRTVHARQSA